MNNNPKISVVMTVYNGERYVKEAIDSILNQTFTDFEFIIVDNASTDGTKKIILSYSDPRIVLIKNKENLGQTKALNIGIKHSKGNFIARMDADDISLPQRLELQCEYLMRDNSVAILGTWHEEIDEHGKHIKYFRMPTDPFRIKCYLISPGRLSYYCLSHPTVIMRKDALLEIGAYNDNYLNQDYDLWVRLVRNYKIANLNKFLVKHRVLNSQQSKKFKDEIEIECEKIIISNIRYYLPSLEDGDLMPLVRMLQFRPQGAREDGLRVIDIFNIFFREYLKGYENAAANKIRDKMILFYLLQLLRTNPVYAIQKLLGLLYRNPEMLLDPILYDSEGKANIVKLIAAISNKGI